MSTKPHSHTPGLIFAWEVRDYSLWRLFGALVLLMAAMAGFFFIFRIVHPVVQRPPVTPQHVISLDPSHPAELALIHLAQDRSFPLLTDAEADEAVPVGSPLLAFRPSFEGHKIALRELDAPVAEIHQPRLFTATADVLPPVQRRELKPVAVPPAAKLHALMSAGLARRGPAKVELTGIKLTQPTRVQFRVGVGSAGQVTTALPLSSVDDPEVMQQLLAAVNALRFSPVAEAGPGAGPVEWGEISFRWEAAAAP